MRQSSWLMWLSLTLFCLFIQSFYSMLEMAAVSFNKVRLQYYYSKGEKRAIWLNYLLQNPSRLFGTTLLGVNIALQFGSQCSRELYSSLDLDPNLAPITQIFVVLIFAELAPIFAARRYAEHVVMLGIPIIYASAIIMKPFLWVIGMVTKLANFIVGGREVNQNLFLSREELQKIIEEQDEDRFTSKESREFNIVVSNIFNLKAKLAGQIMDPLSNFTLMSSSATITDLKKTLKSKPVSFIPIYHRDQKNIVGIALPRDMIRANDTHRVRDYAQSPWFIPQDSSVTDILAQFRRNNETVSIVLNVKGQAVGIITLDDIIEEIFGKIPMGLKGQHDLKKKMVIERTFPGYLKISELNTQFGIKIDFEGADTLAELIESKLGHRPEVGESIYVNSLELIVKEVSLLEIKTVLVKT